MNTIKKENSSTIEIVFDKHGNKFSMFETVNAVYGETIIKEHIMSSSRDNTTSPQSDNVEDIGEINHVLMIESGITNKRKIYNWNMIIFIS